MQSYRVIPTLLLKGEGLVKTVKFKDPHYVGDPRNAIRIFNEKEVDELVFLDIMASKENRGPNFKMLQEIASECFMPVGYGGGIRTVEAARKIFNIGIEKVILNTAALETPELVSAVADISGSQSVVVSIDVKKSWKGAYRVYAHSRKKKLKRDVLEYAQEMEEKGAGEIIINSVDRDGTYEGYDLALVSEVSRHVNIPVIASGGASSLQNLKEAVLEAGASAVTAGSLFIYHGVNKAVLINYPKHEKLKELFKSTNL